MTTLDDKLLGLKTQNYVSSSESEGEDEDEKSCGEDDSRDDKIDLGGVAAPPDFRLEVPKVSILYNFNNNNTIVIKAKLKNSLAALPYFSLLFLLLVEGIWW